MKKYTAEQYRRFAFDALLELVNEEHAVVWDEAEAKLGESRWPSTPSKLDVHHLQTARTRHKEAGSLTETTTVSKGGHPIVTLQPADQRGRIQAIKEAAQRKRALHARYLSWAIGNAGARARIGPAGEMAVHASLLAAASVGYLPLKPQGGDIRSFQGEPMPGGALDNAAWLTVPAESGPPTTHLVMIEVKNVRSWIYPSREEPYQVLDKAAKVANLDPSLSVIPILVCRRSSWFIGTMAKDLGFLVVSMDQQPVVWEEDDDDRMLTEVQTELAYDLVPIPSSRDQVQPVPRLVGALTNVVPAQAQRTAERWNARGRHLADLYASMRAASTYRQRDHWLKEIRAAAVELGCDGAWAVSAED